MKNFLSPVLIVLAAIIGYFYLMPLNDHVNLLKDKRNKHAELLQSIESIGSKISQLETQYNSFTPRERAILTRLIPREVRETVIVNDLTELADANSLTVTGVEFTDIDMAEVGAKQIGRADDSLLGSRYELSNLVINVQGSYGSFKDFLGDLGRSVRIADVSHISINQNETGGLSLTEYQLTVTIYSLE